MLTFTWAGRRCRPFLGRLVKCAPPDSRVDSPPSSTWAWWNSPCPRESEVMVHAMGCFWEGYRRLQGFVWPGRSRDTDQDGMRVASDSSATLWCSLHFRFMDSIWSFCWLLGQGLPPFWKLPPSPSCVTTASPTESLCIRSFPHHTDRSYLREEEWFLHLVPEG